MLAVSQFDDGMIDMRELIRRLAEQVVNAIMDAEADQLCAAALNMSFSGPSRRTRSSRSPSKPSKAISSESPMGTIGFLSAPARHARPRERDRPGLQRRVVVTPGSARLPLVRCVPLVEPLAENLPRGVLQLADRARNGPPAFLDRLDGLALSPFCVARHLRTPNRTGLVQLFVRIPVPTDRVEGDRMAIGFQVLECQPEPSGAGVRPTFPTLPRLDVIPNPEADAR